MSSFNELREMAHSSPGHVVSVAGAEDPAVLDAVEAGLKDGLIAAAYLIGDASKITDGINAKTNAKVEILQSDTPAEAARLAVEKIRSGACDILMKGSVDSTNYLKAVVNRDTGLRKGGVLSNVTVAEIRGMGRLLAATDNGIMPMPTLDQKRHIILNTAPLFRGCGFSTVRVAAVCATEKVSGALPATQDAASLAEESAEGKFDLFEIGGPMGYDVAVSPEAAKKKGLDHLPAAGEADLLLFPNIDAANSVVKSWKYHGGARTGSIVLGATAPILLNSRSDSAQRRLDALLLAAAVIAGERKDK
jgi:phosphate butyryltransferase